MKAVSHVLLLLLASALDVRAQIENRSTTLTPPYTVESAAARATPVSYNILTRVPDVKSSVSPIEGLTPEQIAIVEKLNRANAARLKRLSRIVVPATWLNDENAYSPFPREYAWGADKPKAIVVDQTAQAFAAYEHGRLVRWGPVSSGARGETPSGLFHLSWRSRGHRSSIDPSWYMEWYFNFIPSRGVAFHKYSLPGRAASHGCVRMLERDAEWLYHWGETPGRGVTGTPVLVLGCPDPSKQWHAANFLERGIALPHDPSTAPGNCRNYSGSAPATERKTIR